MITLADLRKHERKSGLCLLCECCGDTFSATAGDYFWKHETDGFICGECKEPLVLVQIRTVHREVSRGS